MNKREFISKLRSRLSRLRRCEREDRIGFYCEMIDDRVEEGLSEAEAVAELGSINSIAEKILAEERAVSVAEKKHSHGKGRRVWEIILLALGSPIWLSLLIAAASIAIAFYVVLWSVILSLWAVFLSIAVSGGFGIPLGIFLVCKGHVASGLVCISLSLVCLGITLPAFYMFKGATKGCLGLTKKLAITVVRKEKRV